MLCGTVLGGCEVVSCGVFQRFVLCPIGPISKVCSMFYGLLWDLFKSSFQGFWCSYEGIF